MYLHAGEDEYVTRTAINPETGLPRIQQTRLNGMLHARPTGEPSQIVFNDQGRPKELYWHAFNLEHNSDGPAIVILHTGTDLHAVEAYNIEGQPRESTLGPYMITREIDGTVINERYATEQELSPRSTIGFKRSQLEP